MDQIAIVKRAWHLMWRHKVLWIFGILVALTGGGGGGQGMQYTFNGRDFGSGPNNMPWNGQPWNGQPWDNMPWGGLRWQEGLPALFAVVCCLLFLVIIAMVIVQYVSRAALIRSVDAIEERGGPLTWREALRLGWTNRTFRLWLLELIVGLVAGLAALALLAVAASPLLLLITDTDAGRAIGIIGAVLLGLVVIFFLIVAAVVLSVLREMWSREILLADKGVGQALGDGWALVRSRARDLGGMWLVMLGIGIGFAILMIPVVLLIVGLAAGLGGGLGYLIHELANSTPWAVAVGLPIALVLLAVPFALIGGLYAVFTHGVWTLAYRRVTAPILPPPPEPEPEPVFVQPEL